MRIQVLNNDPKWQTVWKVFRDKDAGLFFSEAWQQIYEGRDLRICLLLNKNEELIGAFQYLHFKKGFFKMAITPPFCPSIGLSYHNPGESVVGRNSFTKELLTVIADYFRTEKLQLIDLALPAHIVDTQPFTWKTMRAVLRYSYLLNLQQTEEELWNKLAGEKRKSISKAIKDELVIERSEDFSIIANFIVESLRRNKALKNEDLIRKIISSRLAQHAISFTAKLNGELLAASFCVRDGNKVIYLFGGTSLQTRHHGAAVSCMWKSILLAKQTGAQIFDFEGSMQPGIEKYFREFGGDLISYPAIEKRSLILQTLMHFKK